ncbi:hypothetical protein [Vibrio parahaemolyticus]|uniref:hypothetical protein n=1 Tax=Vibrio parahaemolyticus TaxID=670 RepID=UPI002B21BA9C|nr:hypothetical protein [Vibrio parahaemolyticus]MEA5181927.1 hypothetical protein [Vibrio parahaemolyticus]HAV1351158.1 hypothetical protein [Vibrio parahaemolyticus]
MDKAKNYYIEKDNDYFVIKNSNGEIEYEIIDFEPDYNPPRLVVRKITLNNRVSIKYDLVENIFDDYPEYCF